MRRIRADALLLGKAGRLLLDLAHGLGQVDEPEVQRPTLAQIFAQHRLFLLQVFDVLLELLEVAVGWRLSVTPGQDRPTDQPEHSEQANPVHGTSALAEGDEPPTGSPA